MTLEGEHVLVIGGGGFLGRSIVDQLLSRSTGSTTTHSDPSTPSKPVFTVSVFDLRQTFTDTRLDAFIIGDITNSEDVSKACEGKTIVVHTASPHQTAPAHVHRSVNIDGTRNVIRACVETGVRKLVYTSSASVVFDGTDLVSADESTPYCVTHMDVYNETKAVAEAEVLAANGQGGLLTIALRPSGIFGPRDMQGAYTLVKSARRGQWRIMIGTNETLFDMTFVENAAYAHVLAAERLSPDNNTAGEAFIITNDQPILFWDYPKLFFNHLGYKQTQRVCIPRDVGLGIGSVLDTVAMVLRPVVKIEPTLTRFRVKMLTANRYFDISKAKERLGYRPVYSMEEGIRMTAEHWRGVDPDFMQ